LEISGRPLRGLTLNGGLSYNDFWVDDIVTPEAPNGERQRAIDAPPWTANWGFSQEVGARPRTVTGSLNLGVTSLVAGYFLADLLARFRRVFPNVQVQVVEDERPYIEHLLINGELHLALMLVSNLDNRDALDVTRARENLRAGRTLVPVFAGT